jgi:hypothetical protein
MKFGIDVGLPQYPAGLSDKDAGLVLPLYRAISALAQKASTATGQLQLSPAEMALSDQFDQLLAHRFNRLKVRAAEAIGFGQAVNLILTSGVVEAQLADATTTTKPCHGLCDVPTGLSVGQWGEIIFMNGRSQGVAGTVFGSRYFLSTTPGAVQLSPPASPGNLVQLLGVGLGSAGFYLQIIPGGA